MVKFQDYTIERRFFVAQFACKLIITLLFSRYCATVQTHTHAHTHNAHQEQLKSVPGKISSVGSKINIGCLKTYKYAKSYYNQISLFGAIL